MKSPARPGFFFMKDIQTRADLEALLSLFYERLLKDSRINYIFTDVARIDLPSHLPKIVDFWEQNILGTGSYQNNVLKIHQDLNAAMPLNREHFSIWLSHLNDTTDEMFTGVHAEMLKTRALSIATVMQIKLQSQ